MVGGIVQAFSGVRRQGGARVSPQVVRSLSSGVSEGGESRSSSRTKATCNTSTSGSISTSTGSFLSARTSASGHQVSSTLTQTSTLLSVAEGGEKEEPAYSETYLLGQGESPSMLSQARLAASTSARRGLTQDASAASHWGWSGRLVARILPRSFDQYEAAKPKWAIDPAQLEGGIVQPVATGDGAETMISALERQGSEGTCGDVLSLAPADEKGCQYDLSGSRGEDDLFVTLDVFLFRRYIPSTVNIQRSIHGPEGLSLPFGIESGSDSGSVGSHSSSDEDKEDHLLFIHMKRDADETAHRTLRRLELSTEKKMQSVTRKSGRGKKKNKARKENIARIKCDVTSSSSIVVKTDPDDEWNNKTLQEMSLSGLTNGELWRKIVFQYDVHPEQRGRVGVSVLNPDAEEDSPDSRIHLDVISCPPTILRVQIFVSTCMF